MNAYAILGIACLAVIITVGLAMLLVKSSAREAGASEVKADVASAEANAEREVIKIANQGVSDEKTVDKLRDGEF